MRKRSIQPVPLQQDVGDRQKGNLEPLGEVLDAMSNAMAVQRHNGTVRDL